MTKKLSILIVAALVLAMSFTGCSKTAPVSEETAASQLMVGAAVRDITPSENMFPLTRMPQVEIVGVLDPIHVRAIALSSGGTPTLMICSETGRGLTQQGIEALAEHTGLPLESIFSTATHSHATPENGGRILHEDGPEVANQKAWEEFSFAQTLAAADEALANMKPASFGIGKSESYVNVYRLSPYNKIAEDGSVSEYYDLGYDPSGPSDKEVIAVRFNDENGDPIAFIVNYAVHGTVMHANTCIDGKTGVSADIPGLVSDYLEEKYKGSVAMWTSGCAGDQNPVVQNDIYTRNPMTGEFEEEFTGNYDILLYLSKIHYADVETAISKIEDYTSNVSVINNYGESAIPARDSGDFAISVQLLRIGDLAIAGFAGEPFTSIGMYMKDNSLLENTMIVAHSRGKNRGYQADDESIAHGGFGTNAGYKPGYLKEGMTTLMNTLIAETNE